jgi:hypothetical protein
LPSVAYLTCVKKLLYCLGCIGLFFGVVMIVHDALFIGHYGFDANDVIDPNVDWPTGERPGWANYAQWKWGLLFALAGLAATLPAIMRKTASQKAL